MKKKNVLALIVIILVLIGTGIGGFFIIKDQMSDKIYKEKMEEGKKYLAQMKYEEAVAAFEFALEKKPEEEAPYISIYRVRIAQGEIRLAQRILQQGYRRTGSERITGLLETCEAKLDNVTQETVKTAETVSENEEQSAQNVIINTAIFQKLEKYTFASYTKDFGKFTSNEFSGGILEMVHGGIEAVFTYQNGPNGEKMINTARNVPENEAKPVSIRLSNIALLFKNFGEGVTYDRLCSIAGTKVDCSYSNEADSYVDTFTYKNCKIELACEENGDIVKTSGWNRITPPEGTAESQKGAVDGVILNAVNGQGLQGVSVLFKPEDRALDQVQEQTDASGSFSAELDPGSYQVEVSKEGFITDSFEVEVEAGTPVSGIQFTLSPELTIGEIRIVLTWNAFPTDLDSHLSGTTGAGDSVDIWYGRRESFSQGQAAAELDVDEVSGFGPETTTIYMDGNYDFWVEDFTHSGEIGSSGAQVKVYTADGGAPEIFNVPQGSGNTWNVFRLENGRIVSVNTITE